MNAPSPSLERRISPAAANVLRRFPVVVAVGFTVFLWIPATRQATKTLFRGEHTVVELLTFVALLGGGILGLALARTTLRRGAPRLHVAFHALFSLGLLVVAMEEIAWGQWFIGFETPEPIREINDQGELTLHNIEGLQGNSEYMRLAFAIGGLIGLALNRVPRLRDLAVPGLLRPWIVVITVLAVIDLLMDFLYINYYTNRTMGVYMSEITEMLIGMTGLLYFWLKRRASDTPSTFRRNS